MSEEVLSSAPRETPFGGTAGPATAGSSRAEAGRASMGSILSGGTGAAFRPPVTLSPGIPDRSSSLTGVNDTDPSALLSGNPPHSPPSLVQRTYRTETLFQYYAQRGYKELLNEPNSANAAKAAETCLKGRADSEGDYSPAAAAAVGKTEVMSKPKQPRNTHVIDRCLAEAPQTVAAPLRPPHAQDGASTYRTQQADDAKAQAKARRREHLQQPPAEAMYTTRFYPAGADVLPSVQTTRPLTEAARAAAGAGSAGRTSPSLSLSQSAPLGPGNGRSPAAARLSGGSMVTAVTPGRTPSLCVPLRTPDEIAAQAEQQRDARRQLQQQMEDVFVAAFHHRDPAAAQRARDKEADAAMRRSSQQAAEMLAATAADGSKKRGSSAASRPGSKQKKTKSTGGAAAAAGGAASGAVEGGVPSNLALFRSALLMLTNEDGAVTLEQLCAALDGVPFNVSAPAIDAATSLPVTPSATAVQRLFRVLLPNTRAPNAVDATDILLAVASVSAPHGGYADRHGENSLSYGAGGGGANNNNNATARGGGGATARRGVGASISASIAAATNGRPPRASILGTTRGATNSVSAAVNHPPATSVSFASNALHPRPPQTGSSATWAEPGSPAGSPGRQTQQLQQSSAVPELRDSRKCVLIIELLDALDALLNSAETKNVVRWECFQVLAAEGNGYIHKSQLATLRRHAYRDGSAAETEAAVTASMVRALEDAFAIVATEEEAAFLKANKKGRKGSAGAGGKLNSNQKSALPPHLMRRSHMDYGLFCRFFEELPQMPAAFAHVWVPLLVNGARHSATMTDAEESARTAAAEELAGAEGEAPVKRVSTAAGGRLAGERASVASHRSDGRARSIANPSAVTAAVSVSDGDGDGFPLELLGGTTAARQLAVQRLLTRRLEQLQDAWDALEKERLQNEPSAGSGAFASPDN